MKTALKRRYGQHFLRDTGILRRIIGLIQPAPEDLLIEIGAGDGALSARLAPAVNRLVAVEIDGDHIPALRKALLPFPNARILAADFLTMDLIQCIPPLQEQGTRLRIAGNLPYNIGTAIIEKLLSASLPVWDMTFMLQFETAARIAAAPGSRDYGFFSVYCQHYCEVKVAFKVSPACFVPRPKVMSAMITMRLRGTPRHPGLEDNFLAVTKAAFAYRRKKLVNSLLRDARIGPVAEEMLLRTGIDGTRRAEDLSVREYQGMAAVLATMRLPHGL